MLKIIIFGAGGGGKRIGKWVDHQQAEIIAYADNDPAKEKQTMNGVGIIAPGSISRYEYDYILIASAFYQDIRRQLIGFGVLKDKIICLFKYWQIDFRYLMEKFLKCRNDIEAIITGISYANYGIRTDYLDRPAFNFALPSQDLYYDYQISMHILNQYNGRKKLKYFIICLAYYSFQYDMSKTVFKDCIYRYARVMDKYHGISGAQEELELYEGLFSKIFSNEAFDLFYASQRKEIQRIESDRVAGNQDDAFIAEKIFENSAKQALKDYNKNYPATVEKNKSIFSEYIEALIQSDIQPICIVLPAYAKYVQNVSRQIGQEFREIMTEFKSQYHFQYYDFFNSTLFDHTDFRDCSHLNYKGAEKFTKMLNNTIAWC